LNTDETDRKSIEAHLAKVRAPFMYLDYMDQGHFNVDDVTRAKAAADGSCWAKWIFFEK